jgi:hypothetical protein
MMVQALGSVKNGSLEEEPAAFLGIQIRNHPSDIPARSVRLAVHRDPTEQK